MTVTKGTLKAARKQKLSNTPVRYHQRLKEAWRKRSRKNAIHVFCNECFGWPGGNREIEECTSYGCPLYEYRPRYSGERGCTDGQSD